ncbi:MAG: hypothetical protein K0S61_110 [Anaerocolumna sp.]|jgi:hypothetical protein|nr:hypothetical protein [Anaerocolumna sp.]
MENKRVTKRDKRTNLEKEIDSVLEYLKKFDPDSEEYAKIADNLGKLYKAKENEHARHVKPDTIAIIAGNLLGIGMILGYEKAGIITSKALSFVVKGRL